MTSFVLQNWFILARVGTPQWWPDQTFCKCQGSLIYTENEVPLKKHGYKNMSIGKNESFLMIIPTNMMRWLPFYTQSCKFMPLMRWWRTCSHDMAFTNMHVSLCDNYNRYAGTARRQTYWLLLSLSFTDTHYNLNGNIFVGILTSKLCCFW